MGNSVKLLEMKELIELIWLEKLEKKTRFIITNKTRVKKVRKAETN